MNLKGHRIITDIAVREFLTESSARGKSWQKQLEKVVPGVHGASNTWKLSDFAVQRDLNDVFTFGHWSNFAQKHHFMRKFEGQQPIEAYWDACKWIHGNATAFANAAARGKGPEELQSLGNACHAVEDSFAEGHAVREKHTSTKAPGAIRHIKRFAAAEKKDHGKMDNAWAHAIKPLSPLGELVRNAVKALLVLVFDQVERAANSHSSINALSGWEGYRQQWLGVDRRLHEDRDDDK